MNNTLRNFAAGLALAAAVTTPGCKKNAESASCIDTEEFVRHNIRHALAMYILERGMGNIIGLDDLCSGETVRMRNVERSFIGYMDDCDVPAVKEDALKIRIKAIKILQMKTCSDANQK